MKIALITTTINVPRVLSLYRAHDTDVMFFVAGDLKTPAEAFDFCAEELGECIYLTPQMQEQAYPKSSKLISWNSDSRRNFALLEAMKWKPDIIISVDDDMIPMGEMFFTQFESLFLFGHTGLQLGAPQLWLDAGQFTIPPARQRGIPVDAQTNAHPSFVHNARIGAAQGIILGVPDASATEAIANHPHVHSATDIFRSGLVAHPKSYAVYNSQLTAFRAELAPAFAQFYFAQGRNTDIFSSLLMRRIMREKNLYTYYGPPFGYHARHKRPLLNDLRSEMIGNERMNEYADYLNRAPLPKDISVTEQCRILAQGWNGPELEAAMAWYDDCDRILT